MDEENIVTLSPSVETSTTSTMTNEEDIAHAALVPVVDKLPEVAAEHITHPHAAIPPGTVLFVRVSLCIG